ncbi:MAG TPA: hypothetical protein VFE78_17775 [Gemmataceae bacterium]|jgi:hypothetical protein|nr:hypothetical protein [Gemmataceae bacterium]
MPIPLTCACGRSLRIKDEYAGKQGKCPGCGAVLDIPKPEAAAEDEALEVLLAESPDDEAPPRAAVRAEPPEPGPRRSAEDEPPRRKPRPVARRDEPRDVPSVAKRQPAIAFEEGWFVA